MNFTHLLKELKKRLKRKKGLLSLGAVLLIAGAAAWLAFRGTGFQGEEVAARSVWKAVPPADGIEQGQTLSATAEQLLKEIRAKGEGRPVESRKVYVCGEETVQLGTMVPQEIELLHNEYPHWAMYLTPQGTVVFTERIDDLSQQCKDHAYFGLDKDGNLSLFNDVPSKEQVLRTFFQLNIEHLKSSLPADMVRQLYDGIRVTDLEEYNSVLSTFSDFAVDNPRTS